MGKPSDIVKDLICVTCPMGCAIHVTLQDDQPLQVSGQVCKKGAAFAQEEILSPRRMFTTTVLVHNGLLPLVPVRSRVALPKKLLFEVAAILRKVVLQAPVYEHQVVLANVLGCGVDIIASRTIERHDIPEV